MAALAQEILYTVDDIYALPDGQRAELIDGRMYMMATPNLRHQKIVIEMSTVINNYIKSHGGKCEVYTAPFAVFLNKDNRNYFEPDITVICDKDKLDDKGCVGAPDWIIEITSPTTLQRDYAIKLFKYRTAGVREYWIVNPQKNIVNVYDLENEDEDSNLSNLYNFDDTIPVCIYEDLSINIAELLK